jgi:hypothetical protein
MKWEEIVKTNLFKVFVVLFTAVCIIKIFAGGYSFGQWLYIIFNR